MSYRPDVQCFKTMNSYKIIIKYSNGVLQSHLLFLLRGFSSPEVGGAGVGVADGSDEVLAKEVLVAA